MKADPFQVGDILKNPKRFIVPIYQRTYAWKVKPHLETFFDQIEAKATERLNKISSYPHYMGAILVIPRGAYSFGRIEVLDIVDGQQRLTTFQLFIAALRDLAKFYAQNHIFEILGTLLVNPEGPQVKNRLERYKLFPTEYDRKLFCDLIDLSHDELRKKYPASFYKNGKVLESAELPLRAWGFLRNESQEFIEASGSESIGDRLSALSQAVLEDFQLIVITLGEHDDAQVIFETLNAGGEPLAAMDLVRNDVFHRAVRAGDDVEALMEHRWRTFENPFWKEVVTRGRLKKPRIDFFLSDTLAAETGEEILLTELYARYKTFVRERHFETVDAELELLLKHAPTYRMLAQPSGSGPLAKIARHLAVFDVGTAYPLIFVVESSDAPIEEKAAIYDLVLSYIVRRILCGLTAKAYNNIFLRIGSQLRSEGVSRAAAVRAFTSLSGDSARFPYDNELRENILNRKQYGSVQQQRLRHILCELEHASRDKFDEATALPEDLTIEHVLPDSWAQHWPLPDGTTAAIDFVTGMNEQQLKAISRRDILKHTLGNLTLLTDARNPSLGNQDFASKREKIKLSLLKMNQGIAAHTEWSEKDIENRSAHLAELAMKMWPTI